MDCREFSHGLRSFVYKTDRKPTITPVVLSCRTAHIYEPGAGDESGHTAPRDSLGSSIHWRASASFNATFA